MIKIDNNYHLVSDGFKGVELVFEEIRQRKKVDSKTRKETGEVVDHIFKDSWYYPSPDLALRKYFELTQVEVDIKNASQYFLNINNALSDIKKKFAEANWKL